MTYEVIILGHLHMPLYFIGTFTEYSYLYPLAYSFPPLAFSAFPLFFTFYLFNPIFVRLS